MESEFEKKFRKVEFTDTYVHHIKSKSTSEYDYYAVGPVIQADTGDFLRLGLGLPKNAVSVSYRVSYFVPK